MPELPEVETIAVRLRTGSPDHPSLINRTILGTQLFWERTLVTPSPSEFEKSIPGQFLRNVSRRGKYLVFELSQGILLVHLRMSGDMLVEPVTAQIAKHHRLTLDLEGDIRLAFNDARKFGRVWLTSNPESILGRLGPEPLDESFTPSDFHQRLLKHRRQIKPLLLDQQFIAGLGNIYTDEALNLTKLHPQSRSDSLTSVQANVLLSSIRQVLYEAISRNGTSIDWVYKGGGYQKSLRVYQRAGEPCKNCGSLIQRKVVGQRGTYYCPSCQSL